MFGKGTVSINAENIMPVIKQWLYSDKDIFIREMISNACDAISKHKHLALTGEAEKDDAEYRIDVCVDKKAGTLSFSDNGIGMTADELDRYISQVAFSGATEFISKYTKSGSDDDSAKIIGHFGLGFYSVFMASSHVEIDTLSYQGGEAARWISDDGMTYEVVASDRTTRGTTITLTIDDEDKEFLDLWRVRSVLEKYCGFMPVPIYLTEVKDEAKEEGKDADEAKAPEAINDVSPLWMKKPSDCTDEDYKAFYRKVFHDYEEPLFWIHLNAEFPFNLKGILYFPRIKNAFGANEGVVKLYNNQVFVADNIREVIPEFLLLLKGVIDCPDLPLNVSRSFLQNDGYVKKMSAYITRKVADRLVSEFNDRREDYQRYWDDIHPFVKFGCMRDEKFFERVKSALLLKTTDDRYLSLEEYRARNSESDECTVYYTSDLKRQAQMIAQYTALGRDVVQLGTPIDPDFVSFMEYSQSKDKLTFKRVDADTSDLTEDAQSDEASRQALEKRFRDALGDEKLDVALKRFKGGDMIAMITVDEQARRFNDRSRWYGQDANFPEKRTLVLSETHPVIRYLETAPEDNEMTRTLCLQVADLADMARQPLVEERMVSFLKRSNELLEKLIDKNND